MDWYCKKQGITELTQKDLEGPAFEIVKVFHPDVIHLQYQMEECHKLLTDQVDDAILRYNVSKPLPLGGLQGLVTIQSDFFFNKDLEYLRCGSKGSRPALSISKMKEAYYPDVGLEQMVPDQMWIEEECKYDIAAMYGISHWWFQRQRFYIDRHTSEGDRRAIRTHMRILSVVQIEIFSLYGYDYMKKIVLHATDLEFKHDFTIIDSPRAITFRDKYRVQMIMRLNEIHKFSDHTLQQIDEALDYWVKEFKVNKMNPGLDTRFWTRKDVERSKEFMFAIQKWLKTRRIFRKLETFVGGICVSNSLVHSLRALSTLRRSGLRMANTAAKPYQGDSSEFYLITGIPTCGVNLINGICLNCTYGDGKPVTCCGYEGPLNGGFCSFCASRAGNSFARDLNLNYFDDSQNLSDYSPQPQYQTYSCELCGNDAHYGYDYPHQLPFVYNQDPCFNHNFDDFPQTSPNLQSINEELAEYINTPSWNFPTSSYDDDDDEYSFATQEYLMTCSTAITPDSPKMDSLIMVDKHLDTILETESDKFIKSSVENLVQNPRESEDECECHVPDGNDSQTKKISTFSNPLFDDSTSSDDESSHEEVIHEMSFKTYSNPLFDLDEEIISSEFNLIHNEDLDSTLKNDRFDTEYYLLESLLNRDTLMASSPKIDSLLDEFDGELITIPPRIVNREHEEYIILMERLLYDNSSPRPPKDFHANPNTIIESLPTFPIPVEDSDSLREEIDIFPGPDDSIPPGIESDDYDSEGDDNSTSLPEFESFHVDYPDSGDSTIDVVDDIPVDVPNILPTHPTLYMDFDFIPSHNDLGSDLDVSSPSGDRNKIYDPGICIEVESTRFLATLSPVIDTLLPFSSENEDKVFNHGVLASKEKSPPSSSHRGFKASKLFHHKSLMITPDYEASRAPGFVLHSLELQSLASLWESKILILLTNVYL
ncbi:hypothetical protein Tco_0201906 [Tanacetum coccineum]